jgi:hypothetical protein
MRLVLTFFLVFAVPIAFGFSCKVTCPSGYTGACVGDPKEGCTCSCEKDSKDAKRDVLDALKAAGASAEFQEKVNKLLANVHEFAEQSLNDEKTGKQFTIMLQQQK